MSLERPVGGRRAMRELVQHLLAIAVESKRLGVPAVPLAPGFTAPVRRAGRAATVWRLLPSPPAARYPASDLARPLRALHAGRLGLDGEVP